MHACSWRGTQPTVNYGGESAVHCGDHSPSPPFRAIQGLERKCISVPMHCPKFDQAVRVGCRQPMYVQDAHTGPLGQVHLEHVAETWGVGHVPLDRRNHRLNITFSEYETVLFKSRKLVQPRNGYEGYTIEFSSSCKEGICYTEMLTRVGRSLMAVSATSFLVTREPRLRRYDYAPEVTMITNMHLRVPQTIPHLRQFTAFRLTQYHWLGLTVSDLGSGR